MVIFKEQCQCQVSLSKEPLLYALILQLANNLFLSGIRQAVVLPACVALPQLPRYIFTLDKVMNLNPPMHALKTKFKSFNFFLKLKTLCLFVQYIWIFCMLTGFLLWSYYGNLPTTLPSFTFYPTFWPQMANPSRVGSPSGEKGNRGAFTGHGNPVGLYSITKSLACLDLRSRHQFPCAILTQLLCLILTHQSDNAKLIKDIKMTPLKDKICKTTWYWPEYYWYQSDYSRVIW